MACSSSNCKSNNCHKNEDDDEQQPQNTPSPLTTSSSNGQQNLCLKCKINHPISSTSTTTSSIGSNSDETRFCGDCFRSNIYGKFRLAVTSHAMITPSDNVLVAFSGGPSSRVALQFVHDMQLRAQKNFDASKDKSLPVFGVGVAFIDESAVNKLPSDEVNAAIREMNLVLSNLAPPMKQLHVVPIENVYSRDLVDGKEKLTKVLNDVNDVTGKEDLLLHLRMLALQKAASENGYNRLVLGSCTSRIACHVLAATVKGKGYSLSADIQYVDARWEVPVVLPLRDCTVQELNLICRIDGLKTMELLTGYPTGINGLISSFVTLLQEENPSRESTIVRTAGKLTPFQFNRIPEINDCNVPLATRRRQKRFNLKPVESMSSELFCPICNSPLSDSELLDISSCRSSQSSNFHAACCSSCKFQILPKDPSSLEHFYWSLPQQLVARSKHESGDNLNLLREQIQDCLLSDGED
ncbi:cytoplasmic tRNA 2-thiolation protein 2 [Mercurialis annua]|uniref:cytoplasmic tRNA 2-thiolation protein 2 n=1 Tax=Mercurialis annua TaxID=3986 RepID=UPI002160FB12|nr:cytoplasmic tRNA 2-thiolation protein 2 [Mercurialis annua]